MELPPYRRHPPRYVSHPHRPLHPPPPPPPPNLSEDHNFYPQFLLRPPPPPPIPPLSQSYRPLSPAPPPPPPARPYSPHQSQFPFPNHRPIEDDLRRSHLDFPLRSPPRVFDRPHYDGDRPPRIRITELDNPFQDRRPESWADPPKVPPENHAPFRETIYHHRSFNNQIPLSPPVRTDDHRRRALQGSFRFRGDYIDDGFKSSHTEEFLLGRTDSCGSELDSNYRHSRDHYVSNSSGSSRNFAFGDSRVVCKSNPSRDSGSNLGNYESYHGFVSDSERLQNDRDENWRWRHARPPSRELPDVPVELENNEFGGDDGLQVVSSRRLPHNYDSGKFSFRVNREGNQEFHSPRNKIQKKSALLRIQSGKPHTRNRNDELRFASVRSDDSDPGTFRSRGPFVYSNNRKEEDREGSPVEADVSFKSNALVAKAVVTSSSRGIDSDRTLTQGNRKIRKTPEIDLLNSPITKLSDVNGELNCSTRALDCPSISFEDSMQSEENAMNYGGGAMHGIGSQPCSSSTINSPGNNALKEVVSDKVGNPVGSEGTSSLKIRKKMKVINPLPHLSRSHEAKTNVQPVKADGSISSPPAASHPDEVDLQSEQTTASAAMVLVHNVGLQPYPNEVNALTDCNKIDESSRNIVSENKGTDIDSGRSNVHNTKIKSNGLAHHILELPSSVKTKADEGTIIADGSIGSHTISNFDKDSVELQSVSTFNVVGELGDISQQSCQNVTPALLHNNLVKGYLEASLSVGNANTDFSSPEKITMQNDPVNLCSVFDEVHNASSSDNVIGSGQLTKFVSDIDGIDAGSEFTVLPENVSFEGFPRAIPSDEDNAVLGLSTAEGTDIHLGVFDACDLNNYATGSSCSDNMLINSQWKIPASEIENDDSSNVSFPDVANVLIEPSNTWLSAGSNIHDGFKGCTPNERKDREIQLDLSSPSANELLMNLVGIVHAVDGNLSCPAKDFNFSEEKAVATTTRNFDAGSPPCTGKDSLADSYRLTVGSSGNEFSVKGSFKIGQDGSSPRHTKKRKVCGPVSPIPILSEAKEESVSTGTVTFSMDLPSNNDGIVMQSEGRVEVSNIDAECSSRFPHCLKSDTLLLGNKEAGASFVGIGLVGEGFTDNVSKHQQVYPCPSGLRGELKEQDALVMNTMNHHSDNIDLEKGGVFKKGAAAMTVEEIRIHHIETVRQRYPSETLASDIDQRQHIAGVECYNYLLPNDGLPSALNAPPLNADSNVVSSTNLQDKTVEPAPDKQSNVDSPETLPVFTGSQMFNTEISLSQILKEKGHADLRKDEKHVFDGLSSSCPLNTPLQNTAFDKKSSYAVGSIHSINTKFVPQDASKTIHSLHSVVGGMNMKKNQLTSVVPRVFPGHSSLKKTVPSSHIAKPRTWHRTGNSFASSVLGKNSYPYPVPPQGQPPSKMGKDPSASYIRKGNSLVRKPSSVAAATNASHAFGSSVCWLNRSSMDGLKKKVGAKSRVNDSYPPSCSGTGLNATLERAKTPPVPYNTKLSNCTTFSSGNGTSSPLMEPSTNGCSETDSDLLKFKENADAPRPSEDDANSSGPYENQTSQISNFENQSVLDDENSVSMKTMKMLYVKRKSNQLVAASSSSDLSVQNVEKTEALSSDGYYKRRKNQLVRKLSGVMQKVVMSDHSLNLEGKRAPQIVASSSSRRQSGKGLAKAYKPSKFSLVWTLGDAQYLKKENTLLCEVWPHLFPWKRATHWRSLVHNSASIPNNSSLSTISRKLLLSRKRETVYRRSTRGLSLRISKVLSVGGSSLKWSKSIERNSKKVNEEATLAVAAVQKKEREQNGAGANAAGTSGRNHSFRKSVHCIELHPGERIFRVGSVRYKMDPTRRTLQRISDKELSDPTALQSGEDEKRSSIPKRLLIGNDEYVRIGNGNQLIRDPKKRTRILASEKVRWSLHTARLRLARKNKYCQFFTRFGKCNKDDGKCSYIHDPSKIAVCTKFLKGACSDPNCKLTHKVIPERMQDCSYFLQGLCTNESCPYRHVNVNPNASICEGFLKGYCADGNECQMKHSYVCPMFQATGICPQGSKCKLHHPKSRGKGKKRKPSRQRKNAQGRYFGPRCIDISECRAAVMSEKHSAKDDDDIFHQDGKFAEYIHLDTGDEKFEELNEPASGQVTSCDDNPTDIQLDVDMLIKPFYIMSKNLMTESSPAVDSEKTAGNVSEESSCK